MSTSLSVAVAALVTLIAINNDEEFSRSIFVTNTYLYVILAIMIAALTITIIKATKFMPNEFAIFCLAIILIFSFAFVNKTNVMLRTIIWVLFVMTMGALMYPIYEINGNSSVFSNSAIAVIVLVAVLTYITNQFPDEYFDSWGPMLLGGLFTLIVFQLLDLLFGDPISSGRYKMYAYIGLFVFSAYIMYDTKKIYQHARVAEICVRSGGDKLACADYPWRSMNLFLDILNLFSSMNSVQ